MSKNFTKSLIKKIIISGGTIDSDHIINNRKLFITKKHKQIFDDPLDVAVLACFSKDPVNFMKEGAKELINTELKNNNNAALRLLMPKKPKVRL